MSNLTKEEFELLEDTMKFYLKITEDVVVEDAKFQCLGCLGDAGRGKEDNGTLHNTGAGWATESKLHCPKLAVTTFQKAIAKYEARPHK